MYPACFQDTGARIQTLVDRVESSALNYQATGLYFLNIVLYNIFFYNFVHKTLADIFIGRIWVCAYALPLFPWQRYIPFDISEEKRYLG